MAEKIFTYKQIPNQMIETHWSLNDFTVTIEKKDVSKKLPGWQKNENVQINCELYFNASDISKYIRQDRKASFYLLYHSRNDKEGTSIHGLIKKVSYSDDLSQAVLEGEIPGEKIAGILEVSVILSLDEILVLKIEDTIENKLLAKDIGAILFEETKTIILEGEQSYFPMADIDFAKHGFPSHALYFLQRNHTGLDVDFSTAYRLYFNNQHPQFNKINDIKENEGKDFLLNMVVYDIYKQLIMNALDDESFVMPDEIDPDDHSVRSVYARLISYIQKYYFSNESLDELRKKAHSNDSKVFNEFVCSLQDFLLTFGE